jgi:hypothetical protein
MNPTGIDRGIRSFVVLHHTGIDDPHFDLMFETTDASQLTTFRVQQWPLIKSQNARKLRDHRRAYLNFQGEIPGDRGRVEKVDEGQFQVLASQSGWVLRSPDGKLVANLQPQPDRPGDEGAWWAEIEQNSNSA